MKKKELIKLYLSDLNNIISQSPARDNRISMLKQELKNDKHQCSAGRKYAKCASWDAFTNGCADCIHYYENQQ